LIILKVNWDPADVFMRTINDYYCEECNLTAYQIGGAPPTSGRAITKIYGCESVWSSHPWFWEDAVNNATLLGSLGC
jgi:hypothetical protein